MLSNGKRIGAVTVSVPIDAALVGRLESEAMWEMVVPRVAAERLPLMATLTMRYMDAINAASERGYVHAREDLGRDPGGDGC